MGKKDRARKAAKLKKQQQQAAAKAKAQAPSSTSSAKSGGSKTRVVKQAAAPSAQKKEQPPLVLGFQVGNTNSRVAYQADEHPDLIAAECGSRLIKSFVTFEEDGSQVVGSASYRLSRRNPRSTLSGMKALIAEGAPMKFNVAGQDQEKPAIDVYSTLLAYLKNIGETVVDRRCDYGVMVVSDDATDAERAAIVSASSASPVGLKNVFFLRESTAACLAYGCDTARARSYSQLYVVANVGGSSSRLTVVETLNGQMRPVMSTGSIAYGGANIIDDVFNHFLKLAGRKMPKLLDTTKVPAKAHAKLREACIFAVHSLSKSAVAHVNVEALSAGQDFRAPISLGLFQMLIGAGINAAFEGATKALFDTPLLSGKPLAGIIIAGGGASVPFLQKRISALVVEASGSNPAPQLLSSIEPAEVCGLGAAVQAKLLEETLIKLATTPAKINALCAEFEKADSSARSFPGTLSVGGTSIIATAGTSLPVQAELEVETSNVAVEFNGASVATLSLSGAGKRTIKVTVDISGSVVVEAVTSEGEPAGRIVVHPGNTDNNFAGAPEPEPEAEQSTQDEEVVPAVDGGSLDDDEEEEEEEEEDEESEEESDGDSSEGGGFVPVIDMDDDMD